MRAVMLIPFVNVLGFPLSFGVFRPYYIALPNFGDGNAITYVGVLATGLTFMGAPVVVPLIRKFPKYQRTTLVVGWALCILGLAAGSFATTPLALIATQGVIYGRKYNLEIASLVHELGELTLPALAVGYMLAFFPIISIMNEWWVARRGFAWGVMGASSGASGVVYPFIIEALLARYGYQTTLRALAVALLVLTAPLLPALRPRLRPSNHTAVAPMDWSFFRRPMFWMYAAATAAQSLGVYIPGLYLPSYAESIGLNARIGALLVALLCLSQMLGQVTYGHLSDGRLPLSLLLFSTCSIGTVASLALWGFAKSTAILIIFALAHGFFALAFVAMRMRVINAIDSSHNASLPMFCAFSFTQGIGNILAAPLSGALLLTDIDLKHYGLMRYQPLIVFTGCSLAGAATCVGILSWLRKRTAFLQP